MLSARGRGVLENARAKKRRFDPLRSQRRNFGKLNRGDGRADEWRMSSMIEAARGDHGRDATVLDAVRILVDTLVQLRGSTQSERPEKCRANANRNERAPVIS